jgi:transitional endoplasmic reticulum ATPase
LAKDVSLAKLATLTKSYTGADIEALCREAAMHSLRKDLNAKEVTMKDFDEAIKKSGPSVTPDMEKWYKSFMQQVRQVPKPMTPVA